MILRLEMILLVGSYEKGIIIYYKKFLTYEKVYF